MMSQRNRTESETDVSQAERRRLWQPAENNSNKVNNIVLETDFTGSAYFDYEHHQPAKNMGNKSTITGNLISDIICVAIRMYWCYIYIMYLAIFYFR